MTPTSTLRRLVALVAVLGFLLTACGSDDDADDGAADTTAPVDGSADTTSGDGGAVEVVMRDFEFVGLPDTVPTGTRLEVVNESDGELHELVAFHLDPAEERSVEELLALPPDELMATAGEPAAVLLAAPGGPQIAAVGDGTLDEPGRYAVLCFIPTGIDPQVYLDAAAESDDGPPELEYEAPPHIAHGMFAELIVE